MPIKSCVHLGRANFGQDQLCDIPECWPMLRLMKHRNYSCISPTSTAQRRMSISEDFIHPATQLPSVGRTRGYRKVGLGSMDTGDREHSLVSLLHFLHFSSLRSVKAFDRFSCSEGESKSGRYLDGHFFWQTLRYGREKSFKYTKGKEMFELADSYLPRRFLDVPECA